MPQASTRFSRFELVYGRPVRGPLDILQEAWETSYWSSESVILHILLMRERLSRMSELVQENLKKAQRQQKVWYDRNAREREFQGREQVLVLLPTSANKLLAQWQGPYPIVRKVGKVDYLVDMHDRRKRRQILHANMLRKWHTPTATALFTPTDDSTGAEEAEEIPVWDDKEEDGQPTFGEQLSAAHKRDLERLDPQGICRSDEQPPGTHQSGRTQYPHW